MLREWLRGSAPKAAMAAILTCSVVAVAPAAGASPQDDLAAKQAEARALEAEIAANGKQISILDEQYNVAQLEVDDTTAVIARAELLLDEAARRTGRLQDELAGRAARLYMRAGTDDPLPLLVSFDVESLGARTKYGAAAADQDNRLLDDLRAATEDLTQRRADLQHQRADAETQKRTLDDNRRAVEQAQAKQRTLLAQVKGDIADLVQKIAEQKRREEEARARAAMEKLKQQLEAAKAAAAARAAAKQAKGKASGSVTSSATALPAPNANAQTAVDAAMAQLGKDYVYAGAGPDVFDCSGLTLFAWEKAGVTLPHSAEAQYENFPDVGMDELQPGDLVMYGDPIHHVGMFIGNGQMVQAPQTGDVVKVSSIYRPDFAGASRPG